MITGQTGLIYKGKDGTGRIIKPDEYALKSEVEGVVGDMNNELVKYGKEKISEAITEKGVPTASTEMFDQMATNIRSIKSSTGGDLNIFCQTTQPNNQNGLWIKRDSSEINDIQIKDGIYVEDSTAQNIREDLNYCVSNGWGGVYNDLIFCLGGQYTSGTQANATIRNADAAYGGYVYDTKNDLWTNVVYVPTGGTPAFININNIPNLYRDKYIYTLGLSTGSSNTGKLSVYTYNMTTYLTTRVDVGMRTYYGNEKASMRGAVLIGNIIYILTLSGMSGSGGSYDEIWGYDISTETCTKLYEFAYVDRHATGPIIVNDNILEFLSSNPFCVSARFDPLTNTCTTIAYNDYKDYPVCHYAGNGSSGSVDTKPGLGFIYLQLSNSLYVFGGMGNSNMGEYTYKAARSVSIYDIKNKTTRGLDNVLPQKYSNSYNAFSGYVNGNMYIIGGFFTGGGSNNTDRKWYHTIAKFAINSKDLEPGTIVCDPSSYFNSTEMYNDGKTKLDFGVNQVYYQSADGFSIQPAAVIKNGVVTNIN